jgi:hypothetical protein
MNKPLTTSLALVFAASSCAALAATPHPSNLGNASTPQQVRLSGDAAAKSRARLLRSPNMRSYDLKRMDTNNDGAISRDEFTSYMPQTYDDMGKNGDGTVTLSKTPAHLKTMKSASNSSY